ncbi:L-histidine N(alpha)-methyltransferase [Cupriavidus basilensis]
MPAVPTPLNPRHSHSQSNRNATSALQPNGSQASTAVIANGHALPNPVPRLDFIQQYHEDSGALRGEITRGLLAPAASISPKFFYDVLGSRLFEAITDLPEYYPTRTEAAVFSAFAPAMAARAGSGCVLIDLGAGNCQESGAALRQPAAGAIRRARHFCGVPARYLVLPAAAASTDSHARPWRRLLCAPLDLPPEVRRGRRLFFYPGSSIGNFAPEQARALLRTAYAGGRGEGDGVLIGVDLLKDERGAGGGLMTTRWALPPPSTAMCCVT